MMGVGGVGGVPQGSNGDGVMWDGRRVSVPVEGVTPLSDAMYPWVDEVQVAVELPMGPAGPEGPVPLFKVGSVVSAVGGSNPDVQLGLDSDDGVWEFDFVIPVGATGATGPVGPALNVQPGDPLVSVGELPVVGNVVGDAYRVLNGDGGMDLWVWGCSGVGAGVVCEFSQITGWQGPPGVDGVDGEKGLAHVSPTEPVGVEVGEVWFNPDADGYVPTNLRVDRKLRFGVADGGVWGDQGDLVLGVAVGGVLTEQAKVSVSHGLHATSRLSVNHQAAVSMRAGGGLVLGSGSTKLHAVTPGDGDPGSVVATKGYADTKVSLSGGTMSGALTVNAPSAGGHPVTLQWWNDRLKVGPVGSRPSTLPVGYFYFGYE